MATHAKSAALLGRNADAPQSGTNDDASIIPENPYDAGGESPDNDLAGHHDRQAGADTEPPGGRYEVALGNGKKLRNAHGYTLGKYGTYYIVADGQNDDGSDKFKTAKFLSQPVWIEELVRNIDDNSEAVTIATLRRGRVVRATVSRDEISTDSKLVPLAKMGFPFSSESSRPAVRYLLRLEADNVYNLPVREAVSRMGWTSDMSEFVLGSRLFSADDVRAVLPAPAAGVDESWFSQWSVAGSEDEWAKILPIIKGKHPHVMLAMWVAYASPLLAILRAPGFGLEYYYTTSVGKTTATRVAMSAFGPPTDPPTWDTTRFAAQVRMAFNRSLPYFADESKQWRYKPEDFARTAYDLAQGVSGTKGNKDLGINALQRWALTGVWSGEHTVYNMTQDAGIYPRVLSLRTRPTGEDSDATAERIAQWEAITEGNYGHAATRLIEYLVKLDAAGRERLRAEWERLRGEYRAKAPATARRAVLDRWTKSFAAVEIAGRLMASFYPAQLYKEEVKRIVADGFVEFCANVQEDASYADRSMDFLRSWIGSNPLLFRHSSKFATTTYGKPVFKGGRRIGLDIHQVHLGEMLKERGIDVSVALSTWAEKGWVATNPDGTAKTMISKIHDVSTKCWRVLDHALSLPETEPGEAPPVEKEESNTQKDALDEHGQVPPPAEDGDLPW